MAFHLDRNNPQSADIEKDILDVDLNLVLPPGYLTDDEAKRLYPKVELVGRAVTRLLAGMIKGTVKYSSDELGDQAWADHMFDESCDLINYQLLREAARTRNIERGEVADGR